MAFNLDEKYLFEAEELLKAKLPLEYKNTILKNNGGEIEVDDEIWELYPIFDKADRKRISRTCNHIISETKSCKEFGNFSSDYLAIAGNGCGDQMVLIKETNSYLSAVHIWSHETGSVLKVADNFGELTGL
ncbi:SMI1/KNR4 family protein [Psychromonas arctica]|uniref:SMI1/KNR4 family protein n=1 Tax=Psychromonas arctica TaxID=168275 RepID=UPI002FCEAF1F